MRRSLIPAEMLAGEYLYRRYGATLEDYERAADEDTKLELIDGVLVMHSPASVHHEQRFLFLARLLAGYADATRCGVVLGSRTPMDLDFEDSERRMEPDLLFVRTENLHRLGEVAVAGPADIVIEILSPATRDYDLGEKRDVYADAGVPELWLVDPRDRRLIVERPAGKRIAELSSGRYESEQMAGLWIDVGWLWQSPLPDPNECLKTILRGS